MSEPFFCFFDSYFVCQNQHNKHLHMISIIQHLSDKTTLVYSFCLTMSSCTGLYIFLTKKYFWCHLKNWLIFKILTFEMQYVFQKMLLMWSKNSWKYNGIILSDRVAWFHTSVLMPVKNHSTTPCLENYRCCVISISSFEAIYSVKRFFVLFSSLKLLQSQSVMSWIVWEFCKCKLLMMEEGPTW